MPAPKGNDYAIDNNGGRPPKFDNPKELESLIAEYIRDCPDTRSIVAGDVLIDVPTPTITGLAIYLGFCSRQSMYDYEKREEFSYTIKNARLFIENEYEKKLSNNSCTGAIFALKNMGWEDKQQRELSGSLIWNETKTYGDTDKEAD